KLKIKSPCSKAKLDHRLWIRAQRLQHHRLFLELREDAGNALILAMTFEFYKKQIGPVFRARGSRIDTRQHDVVAVERLEQFEQGAGLVVHRDDNRCLVAAARRDVFTTDDEEARGVIGVILDIRGELLQIV